MKCTVYYNIMCFFQYMRTMYTDHIPFPVKRHEQIDILTLPYDYGYI